MMKTFFAFVSLCTFPAISQASPLYLIHGANFSGTSWEAVLQDLSAQGIHATAPDLYHSPESVTLHEVAQRLCDEIQKQNEPALLVGHSQGGAIITEAAGICHDSVKSLIYVAAVIPRPGEGVFDALSDTDNQYYNTCGVLNSVTNAYDLIGIKPCAQVFMQDASPTLAQKFYQTMVSEPSAIGNSKADYSAEVVGQIPSYYIQTKKDLIISLATQNKIMTGLSFQKVFELDSSHTPFIELHAELSTVLANLAQIAPFHQYFHFELCGRGHDCRRPPSPVLPSSNQAPHTGGGPMCGRGHDCNHPRP